VRSLICAACLALAACSSPEPAPKESAKTARAAKRHPLAKYLELSGFRTVESGGNKLKIRFVVINHSSADIGDLTLKVKLTTTAAKPEDPPVAEFEAKVHGLGPLEIQDVSELVPTKLRVYELPDWQFLKADFDVISLEP
jgi:hypothetical protein